LVIDSLNFKISVFSPKFEFITNFGALAFSRGITTNQNGQIFVSECYKHKVLVFNPDYSYNSSFGNSKTLYCPGSITTTKNGTKIFVVHQRNKGTFEFGISIFSENQNRKKIKSFGENVFERRAGDIAIDFNNNVLVTGHRMIYIFDIDGNFLSKFPVETMGYPAPLICDFMGNIAVAENMEDCGVSIWTRSGDFIMRIEINDQKNFRVTGLALDQEGNLLVATNSQGILVYG